MSVPHTKTNSVKRLKISEKTKQALARRDNLDPENPVLPPEHGRAPQPANTIARGRHIAIADEILRERMCAERPRRAS